MQAQGKFSIIFTNDPPAGDVVKEDKVVEGLFHEGETVRFNWRLRDKDPYTVLEGKILARGFKVHLEALKVLANGTLAPKDYTGNGPVVLSRKKELEARAKIVSQAKENQLQDEAEDLLQNGPGNLCKGPSAIRLPRPPSLPKERSEQELNAIRDRLRSCPCFNSMYSNNKKKEELFPDSGLWCKQYKLSYIKQRFGLEPVKLFRRLMILLVGKPLLSMDGLTPSGKRGCVAIPPYIVENAVLYVRGVYKLLGKNANDVRFNPNEVLRTMMSNFRTNAKKQLKAQRSKSGPNPSSSQQSTSSTVLTASTSAASSTSTGSEPSPPPSPTPSSSSTPTPPTPPLSQRQQPSPPSSCKTPRTNFSATLSYFPKTPEPDIDSILEHHSYHTLMPADMNFQVQEKVVSFNRY